MTRSKTLHCVFERDKGMREVDVNEIIKNIKEMCIEANHFLSKDMKEVYDAAAVEEESPLGRQILGQLQENLQIAGEDMIPICQDTGMAVVFVKVGQEVHITGGGLTDAVNEGVRQGYVDGYLRKSVVKDPIYRENTKDNTPAVIHYDIVPGDKVEIIVAPKGFGSENMSRVFMLKPADGIEGVKEAILTATGTSASWRASTRGTAPWWCAWTTGGSSTRPRTSMSWRSPTPSRCTKARAASSRR